MAFFLDDGAPAQQLDSIQRIFLAVMKLDASATFLSG